MCLPKIQSWLIVHNLQMGVMNTSIGFLVTVFCIIIVNMKTLSKNNVAIWSCLGIIAIAWIIAFIGACYKSSNFIVLAMFIWALFIITWICTVILSRFTDRYGSSFCTNQRCSLTLWLFSDPFHKIFYTNIDYFYHVPHTPPPLKKIEDPFLNFSVSEYSRPNVITTPAGDSYGTRKKDFLLVAIAILIMSAILTMTLLFATWILLYSYYRDLVCIEKCLSRPCDYIVCKSTNPTAIQTA